MHVHDIEDMDTIINQFLDFAREGGNETVPDMVRISTRSSPRVRTILAHGQIGEPNLGRAAATHAVKTRPRPKDGANLVGQRPALRRREVDVRTECVDEHALVRVLDRGPGIPESEVWRVMQPFTRLEASRSAGKGSGLGLAIVERAARMNGGNVKLLRREGGGLEARVELPTETQNAA